MHYIFFNMSCIVCKEPTEKSICKKRECKKHVESLIMGNYVVSWLRDKTELAHTHLMLGYKAFQSSRWKLIAHPYPVYFENHDDLLKAIIPLKELFKETHEDDTQLAARIGEPSYVLIKFILMTAPLLSVVADPPDGCKIYAAGNATTDLLFHGSSDENWYSIIRNGLKSCSGTVWQKNGASYGSGIYLSSSLSMSAGYANGDHIVGVYKWVNDAIGKKIGDIWVVPDGTHIKLQYLIVAKMLTPELQKEVLKKINKI